MENRWGMDGRKLAETALIVTGTVLVLVFAVLTPEEPPACGPLRRLAAACGKGLTGTIDGIQFPDGRSGPLIKALLAGDRSDVPAEVRTIFRESGASHLLALSGLHLGLLYAIISRILAIMGNSPAAKRTRDGLIVSAAFFYVLVTGASPSIVRAFLFISVAALARCLGRRMGLPRILFTALALQLLFSPRSILTPGFQLSYMAVLGIATVFRPLRDIYPSGKEARHRGPVGRTWDMMALSISCQLFTAPIAWIHFHSFPKYFLLTNLLAMPCTEALMTVALAAVALSSSGCCPHWLVNAADALCRLMFFILETISSM